MSSLKIIADFHPLRVVFTGKHRVQVILKWENGRLFEISKEGNVREVLYTHFQKRKMVTENIDSDTVYIVPGKILGHFHGYLENLYLYSSENKYVYIFVFYCKKIKKAMSTYSIFELIDRFQRKKRIAQLREILLKD